MTTMELVLPLLWPFWGGDVLQKSGVHLTYPEKAPFPGALLSNFGYERVDVEDSELRTIREGTLQTRILPPAASHPATIFLSLKDTQGHLFSSHVHTS